MNFRKIDPERVRKMLHEGRVHLQFMASLYQLKIDAGRFFVHEHPANTTSWKAPSVKKVMATPGVHTYVGDMCAYGMMQRDAHGVGMVRKRTKFLTNSKSIGKELSKKC